MLLDRTFYILSIIIIIKNNKQSLRRKHLSRKHVVFREVLHKNKKVSKSKIKNTNVTDLKTTKTSYCPKKKTIYK